MAPATGAWRLALVSCFWSSLAMILTYVVGYFALLPWIFLASSFDKTAEMSGYLLLAPSASFIASVFMASRAIAKFSITRFSWAIGLWALGVAPLVLWESMRLPLYLTLGLVLNSPN